ncbi:MAG TPA: polysaccharide biosynthesis tyrosine autokinase [Candidatus Binatia bacterium]|nr:polysaccharide biosynthesis tyrosine autokinase [Candidatus Binatia bacterium]
MRGRTSVERSTTINNNNDKQLSPYVIQRTVRPAEEAPGVYGGTSLEGGEGLDLTQLWRVIRKRARLIVIIFFSVVALAGLVAFIQAPLYTATVTLMIESKPPQVVDIPQVIADPGAKEEDNFYETQYGILRSRSLAAQVIHEASLEKNAIFTGEDSWLKTWVQPVRRWFKQLFVASPAMTGDQGEYLFGINPALVDTYGGMLAITPVPYSRLVKISLNTPDPQLSARVANAHADAYIRKGLKFRSQANRDAQDFLESKLGELRKRVETAEQALNRYRRDKGIVSLDDKENIVTHRLTDLNARLTAAEADRIGFEAQVRLIQSKDYDSLPAVLSSGLIQSLKGELSRLEGEYASLTNQFKASYPRVSQLKAQIDQTRQRLDLEMKKVVDGIRQSYLAARGKETELRNNVQLQKSAALELKDAAVEYAILAREVDTNRQLYDSVLQRLRQIGVATEIRASNTFVVDKAEPPLLPNSNRSLTLLLGGLLALVGGVGLAFLLEYLDKTLSTSEEVERYLGLPSLGVVPDIKLLEKESNGLDDPKIAALPPIESKKLRHNGNDLVVAHHPLSLLAESYRAIRTAILFSTAEKPPQTILVTSSWPQEGKTVTAINTAVSLTQNGGPVLLIDADLRRGRCHQLLNLQNDMGLTNILTGAESPNRFIRETRIQNLYLLSRGQACPNPAELLGSERMRQTLESLATHFAFIVIDSAPVSSITDSVLLSTMVDGVVLVVGGQRVSWPVVRKAYERLVYVRAKILGVILNGVNIENPEYKEYRAFRNAYLSENTSPTQS